MTNSQKARLTAPDILRVFSVFMVAWFHIWQQSWLNPGFHIGKVYLDLQQIVRHGYMMVDEMLLLSGFLLALPWARHHIRGDAQQTPEDFYRRRFWRIVPSYYLTVLIMLYAWALPHGAYSSARFLAKDLWAHLTFTHTFFYETYLLTPLSAVLWTLAVEVQFYILWPLIARTFVKYPGKTCFMLFLLSFTYRAWVYGEPDCSMYFNQLPAQLDLYACGMLAAMFYARLEAEGKPSPRVRKLLAPAGMMVGIAVMLLIMYLQPVGDYEEIRHGQMSYRLLLGIAGGAFLTCGCLMPERENSFIRNRFIPFFADISFNFYMWHQFMALRWKDWHIPPYQSELPNQAYEQPWQLRYTFVCFLGGALIAAAITYLWEKPIQRWALRKRSPSEN